MKKFFYSFLGLAFLVGIGFFAYQYRNEMLLKSVNSIIDQAPTSAGFTTGVVVKDNFRHFDATQFAGTYSWLGDKVSIIYEQQLLGDWENYADAPQERLVKRVLSAYRGQPRVIFLIQSWSIFKDNKVDPRARDHSNWYMQVLNWARQVLPGTNIGFLGLPTRLDGLNPSEQITSEYEKALTFFWPIIKGSDSLYPSFDVSVNNSDQIAKMMEEAVFFGNSIKKPVFPIMWHRWSGGTEQGKILPDSIIEQQCKFVRENADGIVWWSGFGENWDGGLWYPAARDCLR